MKRIKVKGGDWGTDAENEALQVIRSGGIVLHPTETCYGLAVDITQEDALKKLYEIKLMDRFKPVSIIVASVEDAIRWGEIDDHVRNLLNKYWPGPYTFIVKRTKLLTPFFNKGIEKVGLRNPLVPSLLKIVDKLGHPITTTSANVSGKPECYNVQDFLRQLRTAAISLEPDLVIDGGEIDQNPPSTIYDTVDDVAVRGEIEV